MCSAGPSRSNSLRACGSAVSRVLWQGRLPEASADGSGNRPYLKKACVGVSLLSRYYLRAASTMARNCFNCAPENVPTGATAAS